MSPREVARFTSIARVAIGGALVVAPGLTARGWVGPAARDPIVRLFARAIGVRDLGLGAAALAALDARAPARRWLELALAADATDAIVTAAAPRGSVPLATRVLVAAIAGTGAALGAAVLQSVDDSTADDELGKETSADVHHAHAAHA